MRYSFLALGVLALALCACIPEQQRQVATENVYCIAAVYNSPEAAPLRVHEPFNPYDTTLRQLADRSLATNEEIASLTAVHPRLRACQVEFLARLDRLAPSLTPQLAQDYRDADDDLVLLMQRRMAWGEFNQRRRDRAVAGQQAFLAEQRRFELMQGLAAFYLLNQVFQPVQPRTAMTTVPVTVCPSTDHPNCPQQ
jgi:hypothetical protein